MKRSLLGSLLALAGVFVSSQVSALGANKTTYVRCWYKTVANNTNVEADYVWAQNPGSSSYYKLSGNWYGDGATALTNMFYTNTTQAALTNLCTSTLTTKGIRQPLVKIAAADTSASLNFTIWSNDTASQTTRINKVVVFGDSVSDNGNLWNATNWLAPERDSWFLGHFSNGKVWNEYLSDSLGLPNYNWAVGGAAGNAYYVVPGVVDQVSSYISYTKAAPNYKPVNTLFTMLIGANDIISYGRTASSAIAAEQTALDHLVASGARNILVGNLPDLWRAPEFALRTDGVAMQTQINDFNARVPTMIAALKTKWGATLNIQLLDIKTKVNDMLRNPASYGVTNTTQSCLELSKSATANYAQSHALRAGCTDANRFLFWDLLHPTTHSHSVIGATATTLVKAHFPL